MHARLAPRPAAGLTLIGLLTWAILVGFVGYLAIRLVPTWMENAAIQRIVDRIAANPPGTVPAIRQAFNQQKDIDQTISSISGDDLEISKENDRVVIRYAYEKEIELVDPVFLLVKYKGVSR